MSANHAHDRAPLTVNPDLIAAAWRALVRPGHVHEVRIPKTRRGPQRLWGVASGYFDNADDLAEALSGLTGADAEGIYLTLNPVDPALLARAANRLNRDGRPITTSDTDIQSRRNLFIDIDPRRPAGISATDTERDAALAVRDGIAAFLADEAAWPPPVAVMETGNGGGLIYRLRLTNDADSLALIEGVVRGMSAAFSTETVVVDIITANAARIVKLPGTVAAKGDDTADRPWRLATAAFPNDPLPVSPEMLAEIAALAPPPVSRPTPSGGVAGDAYDLAAMLSRASVGYEESRKGWGTVYRLERCLTSDDHTDGACLLQFPSGAVAYRCHHNRCRDKAWADVRDLLGAPPKPPGSGPRVTVGGTRDRAEHQGSAGAREDEPKATTNARRHEFADPPAIAMTGWVGDYCRLMAPTTESPAAFHLGVGLTVVGSLFGRRVYSQYGTDPLYPNLYTLLVGRSGRTRKDTAIKRSTRALFDKTVQGTRIVQHGVSLATDIGSSTKMIDMLKNNPVILMYISEFTRLTGNARRQSTDTIIPTLMEAFDTPTVMQNNSMANPIEAVYPFLSILAATQPDILTDTMSDVDMNSGFANRWLFVCGNLGAPIPLPPILDTRAIGDLFNELTGLKHNYPEGTALAMNAEAVERWHAWYIADFYEESPNAEEDAMRARHAVLIQKVALIYAITEGANVITLNHLNIGIAVIEWMWDQLRGMVKGWGRTINGQIEARIIAVLTKRGPLCRRDTQQISASRKWSAVEFNKVFDSMVKNRAIVDLEDDEWIVRP